MEMNDSATLSGDRSPDSEDRTQDFLARHGGVGAPARRQTLEGGISGWAEIYAADGYTLRCDWSKMGSKEELTFSEIPPPAPERGT